MMLSSPTTNSWLRASPLEILITRACDPSLHEPNYAVHLEVAEYINTKKANNPREAAMMSARLANHRNPHIAILALALLDSLVKQCGYPFHLQVSTKEFLNELVRRFPERPPPFPGPVMSRILDLIKTWKDGICVESRWREDLGNIRDMHRLLVFKGYRFRDANRHQANLDAAANLKSAEELEEEDREAQSAKLQELIRRGTPRDLAAAQELMKSLAGANPDAKPDYRTQALTDLNKLEQKVILLNELLDNVDMQRGEQFATGDAYDQVSSILASARPKLQKWISDAQTDDPESLDTFLQINDQINSVLNRYEAFKKGDYETASNPIPTELAGGAASGLSLIDFDDSSSSAANPVSLGTGLDDLNDLFASIPGPASIPAAAPVPQAAAAPQAQAHSHNGNGYGMSMLMGSGVGAPSIGRPTMSPPTLSGTPPASIQLLGTPAGSKRATPNYFGGNAYVATGPAPGGRGMGVGVAAGASTTLQPQKAQTPVASNVAPIENGAQEKKVRSKNQLRRLKAKQKKAEATADTPEETELRKERVEPSNNVVYVSEQFELSDPALEAFSDVFARFQLPPDENAGDKGSVPSKGEVIYSDDDMESGEDSDAEKKPLSKKKQRKMARLTVAELKQLVKKPEVVEWTDVTAADPRLLLHLKSQRNTVPIPIHWSAKRDYLQGKRGIEKPPFQLPAYIADTGIATMRDAVKEKEANMSLKAKTRERVQPKMGKVDIDYQKLHDAFFKFQTKPPTTGFGEMYYEGKEFETSLKEKRPGDLSPELVEALSIPPLAPPPWLISMQRFGPPPSYPTLRIPGLNSPIPEGAQWGFHPGGWGKPPLDEYNRPLYGDVFGVLPKAGDSGAGEPIDKDPWGELEPEEEEEEEESESEEEEEEEAEPAPIDGMQTPSGMETPSGMASVVSTVAGGLETPDFLELRKGRTVQEAVDSGPRSLYQVVPEKQTSVRGLMGSERGYDVSAVSGAPIPVLGDERGTKRKANGVDVSIDASELEGLSEDELRRKYEAYSRGSAGVPGGNREDFSDMVAKEMAKKKQKMEKERDTKKGKDFKF
ncbi:hypothetical protein DXG01_003826 [Tephrocybe rancida]|nr:hypothetical protein DXG01_003826 [Tephrocybe rancida]